MEFYDIFTICVIIYNFRFTDSACTWPQPFLSSTWSDSTQGDVVFDTTTLSGYSFVVDGQTINDWTCVLDTFETDGRLIILSSSSFILRKLQFYAYVCMTFTKVTDASYRYYQNNGYDVAANSRTFIDLSNSVTSPAIICDDAKGASGQEFQLMIKTGSEAAALIDCPFSFLGEYGYVHFDSNGNPTCDTTTSSWDMCADNTLMTFDYTQCSTKVAYSETNTVWCVDTLPIGGTNFVMVYNGGESEATVDNTAIYRYACFAITEDGTKASVTPQHCKAGQTAIDVPTNNFGIKVGATLEMTVTRNCSSCPVLTAPDRGFVTVVTEGAVTMATYECDTNYTLYGVSERFCQENNTWTDTMPSCSCAAPPSFANGHRVTSTDGHQTNYSCTLGFSLKGLQIRQCLLAVAEWEDVDPECVPCATIDTPVGGLSDYKSDGVTTQVSFTCEKGYTLAGLSSLTCQDDGTWDDVTPTCAKCKTLTNPISGSVLTSTDGMVTKANYSCANSYDMKGAAQVTCLEIGKWDQNPPTCVCKSPSSPDHGAVVANGSVAVYTCEKGYTISGVSSRTCRSDGTGWSDSDPGCALCSTLHQPTGGAVSLSTDGTVTKGTYTCERGYTLSGDTEIICLSDGQWNKAFSSCAECEPLNAPSSGTFSLTLSGTGTIAVYSCFEGYNLNGVTTRTCLSDGSWEDADPTCTCKAPLSLARGKMISDGNVASYTCDLNYSLNGPQSRTCQTDGSGWTDSNPSCVTCAPVVTVTGGSVVMSTDGINTLASYTCDVGYTLKGTSLITCKNDGSWDSEQSSCVACTDRVNPDSGSVSVSTNGSTTIATYSCAPGYYISSAVPLTCQSNGIWDDTPPTCECSFPSTPANGAVAVSDAAGISVASYTCFNGFTLSGLSTRECQKDGSGWQGADPFCVACEALSSPVSGRFTYHTTGVMTKATFRCDVYTSMLGENVLSCQTDGQWDNPVPICVNCSPLSTPTSGSVSLSTDDVTTTAFYTCVSGYSLTSSGSLTCAENGTWTLPEPSCVCDAPPSPTNGMVTVSSDGLSASYACSGGYELLGTPERYCQADGSGWNGTHPICVEIPATTTTTETPPGMISVHMAIVIILGIVILVLVILLVLFAILYFKVKKTRIGASSERLVEEPEKPNLLPEVFVPPSDTAKIDPQKKPPIQPSPRPKKKTPRKPKKLNLAKLQKRPVLEKSPTVVSASGIDVESAQNLTKDGQTIDTTLPTGIHGDVLAETNEISKQVSLQANKKSFSEKLLLNNQKTIEEPPKPPSPCELSPMPSMDIPIFDDVQPIIGDVQPMTEKARHEAVTIGKPKTSMENTDPTVQNDETITASNIHSVRLPPVAKPPVGHGLVIKRKRKRLGFRNTLFKDDTRESRPKTPIERRMRELGIDRIMTPDLLEQVAFNYIHPVITHDPPSSAKGGRPSTSMSSRTFASYT